MRRLLSGAIYVLSAAVGVGAFAAPFLTYRLSSPAPDASRLAQGKDAPLMTVMLVGMALVALLIELQGQTLSAKTVAMLGVLVAISSVLRFIEVAVPMPGGFSPIFTPIILAGYVFGARFGFLMGSFTLLTSALITGGVGPWLPYQMFTAGWTGMTAGWLGSIVRPALETSRRGRLAREIVLLSGVGFVWGMLYGAIINIYFWPFAVGAEGQAYVPGLSVGDVLARYAAFYVTTSLVWDLARAVGNAALLLLLGAPTVRALARFRRRFHFEVSANA